MNIWHAISEERIKKDEGKSEKFTALKVPRQCPLVLLVKVAWKLGNAFGN